MSVLVQLDNWRDVSRVVDALHLAAERDRHDRPLLAKSLLALADEFGDALDRGQPAYTLEDRMPSPDDTTSRPEPAPLVDPKEYAVPPPPAKRVTPRPIPAKRPTS